MPGIWIYSEDSVVARQLLTAGQELKKTMQQPVNIITLNDEAVQCLASAGADKVFLLKGANPWPESYAAAIADMLDKEQASVMLVGATLRGKDLAAKVAAILKAGLVTDALSIQYANEAIETMRLMYGGLAVRTEATALPALVTIPPRTFAEAADAARCEITTVEVANEDSRVTISNVCPIVHEGADIVTANRIVCVGRGLAKQEDLYRAEQLASAVGAEIGCTRGIAEDYHWLPNERYIGISGQKVKPELYIGMGISGQVQHVVGIRDSKIIVAIDSNEKAPIFEAADYGIVGDLYKVVPLLTAALQKK
ncbi:electron transfer flavoprotein subunit alpha/FixB family protein [Sporomusa acidovorans]|uniref:Protein FixB n=1 Tax=Sporomusa acidovorans (strain ATCC 49682 / DSM 3132 / Mol) TaxID=1123286 RepID=A0ABZ3JA25_SPOA4|nr:electron transfer flavoprotein subunit alpha/FixB family protein [Sporomusa acidovorans]OZC21707.1 acryloyl-CoA reductase electron transfer subunit beta [Sporomusa acidovorans DSM 3132]SDD59524.1 electron transfer flavoprotein alpha subunit apoprotein [Sporomusa acidovorans]